MSITKLWKSLCFLFCFASRNQMMIEKENWPYCFALSEDFQKTEQRGCVSGRLLVRDRYRQGLPLSSLHSNKFRNFTLPWYIYKTIDFS
jgi:hypothetical protein